MTRADPPHDLAEDVCHNGAEAIPASAMPGMFWPAMPGAKRLHVLAIASFLEKTQWWPADALRAHQFEQLAALISHAAKTVPYYRQTLKALDGVNGPELESVWHELPILRKSDLQDRPSELLSQLPPKDHGALRDVSTSGSTGEPVTVKKSALTELFQAAVQCREHQWQHRDVAGTTCVIRRLDAQTQPLAAADKAVRWAPDYASGPMYFRDVTEPLDQVLDWLAGLNPRYLMTYPSYLSVLMERARERGTMLAALDQVGTSGEICDPDLSDKAEETWSASLADIYGAQEVGKIALQRPDGTGYLAQSEVILLEVLDEAGRACAPGEIGRVIVTPLHNFAMPLIRYDLGDYAEVGRAAGGYPP